MPVTFRWSTPVCLLVFILVVAAIQLSLTYPLDADTAYHAAVGRLISQHGILYSFPWTPYSWFADHYADKELIFHLLFVPFALMGISWTTAAQIIGTVAGATVLVTMFLILRAEKVYAPWLWALIPLTASFEFLYRFALVRPFLFSISLAFVVLWSAVRERLTLLAVVSALYPWSYVAWHLPVILVAIVETARWVSVGCLRWKPMAVSIAGITTGLLLHPNTLNLIRLTWIEIVGVLFRSSWGKESGFEQGIELSPTTIDIWTHCLLLTVIMLAIATIIAWRNRKKDVVTLVFVLSALSFGVLTVKSYKFVEYFVPLSVVAFALAMRHRPWRFLPIIVVLMSVVYTVTLNADYIVAMTRRQDDMPTASAEFLRRTIPKGVLVFSPEWIFTGTLMMALPELRFVVALNPRYFYEKDPDMYRLWFRLTHEPPPDTANLIRQRFNTRYVLCLNNEGNRSFMSTLSQTLGVQAFILENDWVLFDIGGSGSSRSVYE